MDQNFLDELDRQISDVGTDEVWKKSVGGRIIWLSPVSTTGQGKVQAAMAANDPDGNNVFEAKKVTLSRSIVGIDNIDLRPYRKAGPSFPVIDPRIGEKVNVDLSTYLLNKLADWGHEFVDVTFDIFADLMESHRKFLLKDTQFENAKDPREELAELQDKVAVLREQLNMPLMIEFDPEKMKKDEEPQEESPAPQEAPQEAEPTDVDFDPFKTVQEPSRTSEPISPPIRTVPVPITAPVPPTPSPIQQALQRHTAMAATESSPESPFQAIYSVPSDVIETRASGGSPVEPPRIDPVQRNVNPRFQRPQGR